MTDLDQAQHDQLRTEIEQLKAKEEMLRTMIDDSAILEDDLSATCLYLKKEVLDLKNEKQLLTNRNNFLRGKDISDTGLCH